MKKIFLFITLLLFSMGAFSQVKFGVKAAVNQTFPSYKLNNVELVKPKTSGFGSAYGFFVDLTIADNLAFQGEILANFRYYNAITTVEESTTDFSSVVQDFSYHKMAYAELPLFIKYNIRLKTASSYGIDNYFGIYPGPTLGFKIAEGHEYNRTSVITAFGEKTVVTNEIEGVNPDFQAIDLSVALGFVLDFEKGMRMGLRYVRSMSTASTSDFDVNYNFLQFSFGYNFIRD